MRVISSNKGIFFRGDLGKWSLALLMGVIAKSGLSGVLEVKTEGSWIHLGWEEGALVGMEAPQMPAELKQREEREILAFVAKQASEAFGWEFGSFSFSSQEPVSASCVLLGAGKLPLAFLLRYCFASSKAPLSEEIRKAALGGEGVQLCLHPESSDAVKGLGANVEGLLSDYQRWHLWEPEKASETMLTSLLALWCVGLLEVAPPSEATLRLHDAARQLAESKEMRKEGEYPLSAPLEKEAASLGKGGHSQTKGGAFEIAEKRTRISNTIQPITVQGLFEEEEQPTRYEDAPKVPFPSLDLETFQAEALSLSPSGSENEVFLEAIKKRDEKKNPPEMANSTPQAPVFGELREAPTQLKEKTRSEGATRYDQHGTQHDDLLTGSDIEIDKTPEIDEELQKRIAAGDVVAALLDAMEGWSASDLFIAQGKAPAVRIDGRIYPIALALTTAEEMERFLSMLLTPVQRERFNQEGDLDVGYSPQEGRRFRVNLHRQQGHLGLVARAIPSGALAFDTLGLPSILADLVQKQRGLILVTGATGSGKSTTLAAMLHHINTTRHAHIVTIEEPIEFVHQDIRSRITQREVGADTQSFHSALRHVVRESPDVIMIGEMRDMETMSVAIAAALTGHLVLATLHTINAVQTLQRIMSYYPEEMRHQVAMDLSLCLQAITSQRLVPRRDGKGRLLAAEVMVNTPAVAQLLREQRIEELNDQLRNTSDPGLCSFNRSLLALFRDGLISYDIGKSYASNPDEFALSAQGMETGIATFRDAFSIDKGGTLDIKMLLEIVIERHASDLHLTVGRPPILRINGRLEPLPMQPLTEGDMRVLLNSIFTIRQRTTYELERELDFALSLDNGRRFRINAYFQKGRMAASMRAIPSKIPDPKALLIPDHVMNLTSFSHGLVLVVGPTGSGKSTTLACLIDAINQSRHCRIMTIEDPIEFTHESKLATVDQREVGADTKSFSNALKYILRQDPDVVLVGEMRDLDTISAALTAAETGHLVFATLHANDAIQTIDRLIDVFPAAQQGQIRAQISTALLAVISQRLLLNKAKDARVAAFEVMVATPAVRNLIREQKLHQIKAMMEASRNVGMVTLDYALMQLYESGRVGRDEVALYLNNPALVAGKK